MLIQHWVILFYKETVRGAVAPPPGQCTSTPTPPTTSKAPISEGKRAAVVSFGDTVLLSTANLWHSEDEEVQYTC